MNGQGNTLAGVYVFKGAFFVGRAGEDGDISRTGSLDMAMEARKSSTCLRDRELWRVSKGQIEGTMEYNSKPIPGVSL